MGLSASKTLPELTEEERREMAEKRMNYLASKPINRHIRPIKTYGTVNLSSSSDRDDKKHESMIQDWKN